VSSVADPDPLTPHRWRLGQAWSAKPGPRYVTVAENGTGEPDGQGRRDDDRLIGALPPDAAALAVQLANERPELRPAIETVIAEGAAVAAWGLIGLLDTTREGAP
jgi:hypothetical protein